MNWQSNTDTGDAERQILEAFRARTSQHGLRQMPPQALQVPYFRGEFNRCVEHKLLNNLIQRPAQADDPGWFQVSMACRINDTKKVEVGWHATVFEMLTAVWHHDIASTEEAHHDLAVQVVRFLVDDIGLDPKRLRVTYCAGGEVCPGVVTEQDEVGRAAFVRAGISEGNLLPVRGPKNFILFVANGERAGPKYEVQYCTITQGRERWIEVATAIVDLYTFHHQAKANAWQLQRPTSIGAGCAFGLERLVSARERGDGLATSFVLSELLSAICKSAMQDRRVLDLFAGDCLILADLVRSSMFLMADGIRPDESTVEGRLIIGLLRRIRRKIATLCFQDWGHVLSTLEEIVERHYQKRYPGISSIRGELIGAIASLPWPESWNPDSYTPGAEELPHV